MRLSNRSQAGSASAFSTPARRSASARSIGSPASGEMAGKEVSANAVPTGSILPPTALIRLHICRYESAIFSDHEAEVGQRIGGSVVQPSGPNGVPRATIDDNGNADHVCARLP